MTTAWVTVDEVRGLFLDTWQDQPVNGEDGGDALVEVYLNAAQSMCVEYLGVNVWTEPPFPDELRLANVTQARDMYTAARTNTDGAMGPDGFVIRTYPMSWFVTSLLRPFRASRAWQIR